MINFKENKHRVRRSVNPSNRIIIYAPKDTIEHGVRQVLFPYKLCNILYNLNVLVFNKTMEIL